MPELYRLADHTHVNTQVEAKHSGQDWEKIDVPTTRKELLAYLNEIAGLCRSGFSSDTPPAADPREPVPSREEQLDEGYDLSGEPPAPAPPPPPPPVGVEEKRRLASELQGMQRDAIVDRIFDAKPNDMAHYLIAAIGRLGELGRDGWEYVQAHRHFCKDGERNEAKQKRPYGAAFDERGLRYLALMQIEDLNGHSAKVDD